MKLHSAVQNEAIVSNVGEIGEFRIRNSAKAFNILSSGLYANKIRAIIRELSCNAVDSHVAAGKSDTPFDVHLPNALEPFFSIRDYGTGLTHDQVTNIYTTYFESTKTDSNEFIGALGLGSKSPFSYTDNFTVTAIRDDRKGIYTAFINEQGVPSIALMMEEQTTDPAGVEVRFAVDQRYDFDKFRQEARYVYEYFKLRPVISGSADFKFTDPEYKEKDITPGVHYIAGNRSYAVMGNIKYPIEIPNAENSLGKLHTMLKCGLVMEFNIGELDFQASREGLSYIPETIQAIKRKLEELNNQLVVHIANEANKIENLWDRAVYLSVRHNENLWSNAVTKYIADTKFELYSPDGNSWNQLKQFKLDVKDLESKYNIVIRGFVKSRGVATCTNLKFHTGYQQTANGQVFQQEWRIAVSEDVNFVITDTKVGALERSKYHWKNIQLTKHHNHVYVIEAADKKKPMKTNQFFNDIYNPPASRIFVASDLLQKDRASSMGKNVTIMHLTEASRQSGRWNSRTNMVWKDAGKADSFDSTETYYYLPISGYKCLGRVPDVKDLHYNLQRSGIFTDTIYGVRKADLEWVKLQKNWVNLDEHVKDKLSKMGNADVMGLVKQAIDWKEIYQYNAVKHVANPNSPYIVLFNAFKDVKIEDGSRKTHLEWLCKMYSVQTQANVDPSKLIDKYSKDVLELYGRYPLLKRISKYITDAVEVAEYINLIDEKKGV